MRRIILIGIVLLFSIGGLLAVLLRSQADTQPKTLDERILEAIVRDFPAFSSDGKPVIGIDSVSSHDKGWYIATIKSLRPVNDVVPVKIVLQDSGNWMRTVAGPDTYFSEADMITLNLPDSVILELQKL